MNACHLHLPTNIFTNSNILPPLFVRLSLVSLSHCFLDKLNVYWILSMIFYVIKYNHLYSPNLESDKSGISSICSKMHSSVVSAVNRNKTKAHVQNKIVIVFNIYHNTNCAWIWWCLNPFMIPCLTWRKHTMYKKTDYSKSI